MTATATRVSTERTSASELEPQALLPPTGGRRLIPAAAAVSLFYPLEVAWGYVGSVPATGLSAIALAGADLLLLLLIASATSESGIRRLERWLVVLAGLILVVLAAGYLAGATAYSTDEAALTQGAAQALLSGHDPYTQNLLHSLWAYMPGLAHATQLFNGQIVSNYSYPALPMLLVTPFVELTGGGQAVPIAYTLVLVGAMVLMFVVLPNPYKALAPLVCAGLFLLITGATNGMTEILAMTPLIYVAGTWTDVGRPGKPRVLWWNGAALGCAISANQDAWLIALFAVTGVFCLNRGRVSAGQACHVTSRYVAVALGVFLALNLVFIAWSPDAWLRGAVEPLTQHAVPIGQGLVGLTLFAGVGGGDIAGYTHAATLGLIACLVVQVMWFRRLGRAVFLLPLCCLFFSSRSLASYWTDMVPVLVVGFAVDGLAFHGAFQAADLFRRRSRIPVALGVASFLPALIFLALALRTPPPLTVSVNRLGPIGQDATISNLSATVENTSHASVHPRFTVTMGGSSLKPPGLVAFWKVLAGPAVLRPGQSGTYRLRSPDTTISVPAGSNFRIAVLGANPESISSSAVTVAEPTER